jgi:hypothetical protein
LRASRVGEPSFFVCRFACTSVLVVGARSSRASASGGSIS